MGLTILKNGERLENAKDPNVKLPMALFDVQDEQMKMLVAEQCREIVGEGKITFLGGIQINTPDGCPDYFFPIAFEVCDKQGQVIESLSDSQAMGVANVNALTSPENNVLVRIAEDEALNEVFLKDTSGEEGRIFIVKEERTDIGDHDAKPNRTGPGSEIIPVEL